MVAASAESPSGSWEPERPSWLEEMGSRSMQEGLFATLGADSCFFLLCLLIYLFQRWLQHKRRRRSGGASPGGCAGDLRASAAEATWALLGRDQEPPLSATALNYLAFLDTGFRLFAILSLIAILTTPAVWGFELLTRGEAVRSVQRTLFNVSSSACSDGFPQVDGSALVQCAPGNSSTWRYHEPRWGDPRPAGYFADDVSMEYCRHLALLCDAPSLAFGHGPEDRRASPSRGECWLFARKRAANGTVPMPGFVFCAGNRDFVPGYAEFALALAYGFVTLVLGFRLLWQLTTSEKSDLERFAVWLTELPVADREDGTPFELSERDFHRVAEDLHAALEARLKKMLADRDIGEPYLEEDKVYAVYVVPARPVSRRRRVMRSTVHVAPTWTERQPPRRMGSNLPGPAPDPENRLAGHAFALLHRDVYTKMLLTRREPLFGLKCLSKLPSYVRWHEHSLFKFGVAPWSAVTLRCRRSPPASDVIWSNLHVKGYQTVLRRTVAEIMLFFVSLSLVAPASAASAVYTFVNAMHELDSAASPVQLPPKFWALLGQAAEGLPSYFLLFVNSVVLPTLIQWLSDMAKPHMRSRSEASQFDNNLFYLVLNSFLVPLMGFLTTDESRLAQLLSYFGRLRKEHSYEALRTLGMQSRQAPSALMLKYAANAALVTSGCQLIQLGKGIGRRLFCLPDEPWPFAWGYWYAWSMSLLVIALSMSVLMPTFLLLAVLFFYLMRRVHKELLQQGTFRTEFEMDRASEIAIACWMLRAVAIFWVFMGLFFYAQHPSGAVGTLPIWRPQVVEPGEEAGRVRVPHLGFDVPVPFLICGGLITLAAGLGFTSFLGDVDGILEKRLYNRFGEGGRVAVVCGLRVLAGVALVAGAAFAPHFQWVRDEIRLHDAGAAALFALAVLVFLAAALVQWLGRRKAVGKSTKDLREALQKGQTFDPACLHDMPGMEDTLSSKGWYRRSDGQTDVVQTEVV